MSDEHKYCWDFHVAEDIEYIVVTPLSQRISLAHRNHKLDPMCHDVFQYSDIVFLNPLKNK